MKVTIDDWLNEVINRLATKHTPKIHTVKQPLGYREPDLVIGNCSLYYGFKDIKIPTFTEYKVNKIRMYNKYLAIKQSENNRCKSK